MTSSTKRRARRLEAWSLAHAVLMLLALPLSLWRADAWPLAAVALASFGFYALSNVDMWRAVRPLGGYANWVSVARLSGVLALGVWATSLPPLVVGLCAVALTTADGLDGYLARKYGHESDFGAHLDMETDALHLCMLTALSYFLGLLPAVIFAVGYTRYVYVLVIAAAGVRDKPLPRSNLNRVIAVTIQYTLAAVFVLPAVIHVPAVVIASALLLFSFARSAVYMLTG